MVIAVGFELFALFYTVASEFGKIIKLKQVLLIEEYRHSLSSYSLSDSTAALHNSTRHRKDK